MIGFDDVALAPGPDAALEQDIGFVTRDFGAQLVGELLQPIQRLHLGVHAA